MEDEAAVAAAAPTPVVPPATSYAPAPSVAPDAASGSQEQSPSRRGARVTGLAPQPVGATIVPAAPALSVSTPPPDAPAPSGLVTPPPPLPSPPVVGRAAPAAVVRQGSCPEMAISLDSSSDDEDMTDVPVVRGSALAAAAAAAAVASTGAVARAAPAAKPLSFSIRLPAAAMIQAAGRGSAKGSGGSAAAAAVTGGGGAPSSYAAKTA
ncbi:unnamed protein product, partial [Scytosiphon promiscuus]